MGKGFKKSETHSPVWQRDSVKQNTVDGNAAKIYVKQVFAATHEAITYTNTHLHTHAQKQPKEQRKKDKIKIQPPTHETIVRRKNNTIHNKDKKQNMKYTKATSDPQKFCIPPTAKFAKCIHK